MGASLKKSSQKVTLKNEQVELLRKKYQYAKDVKSFLGQLNLPIESPASSEFKSYEEKFKFDLHSFGVLLYRGLGALRGKSDGSMCTGALPSNGEEELTLGEEQYVRGVHYLANESGSARLQFVLRLYASYSEERQEYVVTVPDMINLLWHTIALADFTNARELALMEECGYTTMVEQAGEEEEGKWEVPASYREGKGETRPRRMRGEETSETTFGDTLIPERSKVECRASYAVPKHARDNLEKQQQMQCVDEKRQLKEDYEHHRRAKDVHASGRILLATMNHMITEYEEKSSDLSLSKVESWLSTYVPELESALHALIQLEILGHLSSSESVLTKKNYKRIAAQPVPIGMEHSEVWNPATSWVIRNFLNLNDAPSFRLIYSSSKHGHSMNRFVHYVAGYLAPTLLIVITDNKAIFGAYMSQPWETTPQFIGDANCFLWSLTPTLAVRQALHLGEEHFAYLCAKRGITGHHPVGIGIGGTLGNFRLYLREDLMTGTCYSVDNTYDRGPICPDHEFSVLAIEVWGCGSDEAGTGVGRQRNLLMKDAERARKILYNCGSWKSGPDKFIVDILKNDTSQNYVRYIEEAPDHLSRDPTD